MVFFVNGQGRVQKKTNKECSTMKPYLFDLRSGELCRLLILDL